MKIREILEQDPKINKNIKIELLSDILNLTKSQIILKYNQNLTKKELRTYKKYIKKFKKGKPIQYILKKSYFYNYEFYVDKNVLIPRPETEQLVLKTNEYIKKYLKDKEKISILDIGTGSGIIAITLKKLNNSYQLTASDISKKALKVAKKNAYKNNTNINFYKSDMLKNIKDKYDVIISNPPYIPKNSNTVEKIVKENEPKIALYADNNGLYYYEEIISTSKKNLNKENIIAFEIGENQSKKIKQIAKKYYPNSNIIEESDYNGFDRYIYIINK